MMNKKFSLLSLLILSGCGESRLQIQKNLLNENSSVTPVVDEESVRVQAVKRQLQSLRFLCANQASASKLYLFSAAATSSQWGSSFSLRDPEHGDLLQDLRVENILQNSPQALRFLLNAEVSNDGRRLFEVVLRYRERATEIMPLVEMPATPRLLQVLYKKFDFLNRNQVAVDTEAKELLMPTMKYAVAKVSLQDRKTTVLEGLSGETLVAPHWNSKSSTLWALEYQTQSGQFALIKGNWKADGKLVKKELIQPKDKNGIGFIAFVKEENTLIALSVHGKDFGILRIDAAGKSTWELLPRDGNEDLFQVEFNRNMLKWISRNSLGELTRRTANMTSTQKEVLELPSDILPFTVERIWSLGAHQLFLKNQNEERRIFLALDGAKARPVSRRECYSPFAFGDSEESQ